MKHHTGGMLLHAGDQLKATMFGSHKEQGEFSAESQSFAKGANVTLGVGSALFSVSAEAKRTHFCHPSACSVESKTRTCLPPYCRAAAETAACRALAEQTPGNVPCSY